MMTAERYEFVAAGLGGQGVLTMGLMLAQAGLPRFRYVTWLPSYDTFMRGGDVICYTILSDEEIASPLISKPEIMLFLSLQALDAYEDQIMEGGTIILDSSLIDRKVQRSDVRVFYLPAMAWAQEIGSTATMESTLTDLGSGFMPTRTLDVEAGRRISNLILLGAYLKVTGALPLETVEKALGNVLRGAGKEGLLRLNQAALRAGYERVLNGSTS